MGKTENALLISIGPRVRKSPFFEATLRYGATAFTIYNQTYMPAAYGDNVADYWSLVNDVTLWDVTCQRHIEITGPDAFHFVQYLTPRDMSKCAVGQCQYMVLTNEDGGIINDAVLLRIEENRYRLSPGDGDTIWWAMGVAVNSGMDVGVVEPETATLQLQGPKSPLVARELFGDSILDLKYYWLREVELDGIPLVVSRTGWSGELGYEIYLEDNRQGDHLWERIMEAGKPYKIAAACPSTIRSVEGGLLSYRSDITLDDNPFTIGMDRFIDLDKQEPFVGQEALRKIRDKGPERRLIGVEIDGEALPAPNENFWSLRQDGEKVGHITRCVYSPRLERNIGWAKVISALSGTGTRFVVDTPYGERNATVCESPWFKSQIRIPDELKR